MAESEIRRDKIPFLKAGFRELGNCNLGQCVRVFRPMHGIRGAGLPGQVRRNAARDDVNLMPRVRELLHGKRDSRLRKVDDRVNVLSVDPFAGDADRDIWTVLRVRGNDFNFPARDFPVEISAAIFAATSEPFR